MNWIGKILGAFIGLWLAGPIGLVIGFIIGHIIDLIRSGRIQWHNASNTAHIQQIFFRATFLVMGHIAKADGRVSEHEIRLAKNVMQQMQLSTGRKRDAMHYFTQGKQGQFDFNAALTELRNACQWRRDLLYMFVEIQFQAAHADGPLTANERRLLLTICQALGFAEADFYLFSQGYSWQQNYQQQQQRHYQQQTPEQPPPQIDALAAAYQLLGVDQSASAADVKRAYRKQINAHHPDKLVSKGLPEEMMKLATEKAQAIQAAYDLICNSRGI